MTFATLTSGAYIGESCLLDLTKRTASVFAVDYVDTYFITSDSFLRVSIYQILCMMIAAVVCFCILSSFCV